MKIVIASDHGGYELKEIIKVYLNDKGYSVMDIGTNSNESVDYPDFGREAGEIVAANKADKGIVICGTGIGISMSANKVDGIRCALCTNEYMAKMATQHNDANMIALGNRVLGSGLAIDIVDAWLNAQFEGGRHQTRVNKIMDIEKIK